jgi:hypothetical protein
MADREIFFTFLNEALVRKSTPQGTYHFELGKVQLHTQSPDVFVALPETNCEVNCVINDQLIEFDFIVAKALIRFVFIRSEHSFLPEPHESRFYSKESIGPVLTITYC